jgi:hypothetical protein
MIGAIAPPGRRSLHQALTQQAKEDVVIVLPRNFEDLSNQEAAHVLSKGK